MSRRGSLVAGLILLLLGAFLAVRSFTSPPVPEAAADQYFERIREGDLNWIYRHVHAREREVLSESVLSEFYREFIAPHLLGAEVMGREVYHVRTGFGVMKYQLRLKDGRETTYVSFAFIEEGRSVVAGLEALTALYGSLKFTDESLLPVRAARARKELAPWFLQRGVDRWYSSQSDEYVQFE